MSQASFEPDFRLGVRTAEGAVVLGVVGELDSGTCGELMDTFRHVLSEHPGATIRLDLSELSFIDSAGTRAVIQIEREAGARSVQLEVIAPAGEVTELLRTAGVIEHFKLRPGDRRRATDASAVLERVELELPLDPQSPARARAEVRELLAGRDQTELADVVLLTSEIVTNAVVHPDSPETASVGLRIFTYPEGVRVEVDDCGSGFDPTLPSRPQPDRGRGLFLVDRFASRWGTERVHHDRGPRFMVWFELDWQAEGERAA
ncbi:MAG TPA: STAS domain-containing protein [Solirubrobacteraceae bacterium]|nr:STAS domain-containing protein [Solirubrobacteraceae bacterium]